MAWLYISGALSFLVQLLFQKFVYNGLWDARILKNSRKQCNDVCYHEYYSSISYAQIYDLKEGDHPQEVEEG